MGERSLPRLAPFAALFVLACTGAAVTTLLSTPKSRLDSIPTGLVKGSPENDPWPPEIASGWSKPEPLGAPVNTAGLEDSPFLAPDGRTLFFFFTPDGSIPAGEMTLDGVSGIWWTHRAGEGWAEPQRISLAEYGQAALDGCDFVIGDRLYFCSARAGNAKPIEWYYATLKEGVWSDVTSAGEWMNREVDGEMHITAGYRDIVFASKRAGGLGGFDLWISHRTEDGWGEPENLGPEVNSAADENRPFVSPDGGELWYDSSSRAGKPGPAIFRCLRQTDLSWGPCREMVSRFAGEPTLTGDGRTLYFVHHYFAPDQSTMIEADIYAAYRQ
jgi:WD40-like Beta Propeller Repeat